MNDIVNKLLHPDVLVPRRKLIGRSSIVPASSGIYAWYFSQSPSSQIDLERCWHWQGKTLLYVGISPSKPSKDNGTSKRNLRKRISEHMRGNAESSTLRKSLGCLLSEELDIELRRVSKSTMSFADEESVLSTWLERNAFVTWMVHNEPWIIEQEVISELYLPLNLKMNQHHPFYPILSDTRKIARENARRLPVLETRMG